MGGCKGGEGILLRTRILKIRGMDLENWGERSG